MGKLVGAALLILSIALLIDALNDTPSIMETLVSNFDMDNQYIIDIKELWTETQ